MGTQNAKDRLKPEALYTWKQNGILHLMQHDLHECKLFTINMSSEKMNINR